MKQSIKDRRTLTVRMDEALSHPHVPIEERYERPPKSLKRLWLRCWYKFRIWDLREQIEDDTETRLELAIKRLWDIKTLIVIKNKLARLK